MISPAVTLMTRLGLSDEELCEILDVDSISVITGELDHRPELPILLALTNAPAEQFGDETLQRWLRSTGPAGRPFDLLRARDFGAFEDALEVLSTRGFVLRGGRTRD
ncbi:hypothetical protein LRS13_10070 [Svornostia abyssi]|uniref:Uncharacterized protein n=1 Tax=Svornostia abyssi TaxID=2898438 RepID=A0ABY5PMK8_9ACTN|nr:hypothetical protein LRS13_10070 [Parviterribacteraceae bacterium J379]